MNEAMLAWRLGRLLSLERQKAGLTQDALARRAGVSRQQVTRYESGSGGVTARVTERLFEALGLQVRPEVEQLDAHLDSDIATASADADGHLEGQLWSLGWHLRRMNEPVEVLIDGPLAAELHGVPILARRLDFLARDRDADAVAGWFAGIYNLRRYDERLRDFSSPDIDPRRPGPHRWHSGLSEVGLRFVAELPRPVLITREEVTHRVRPLHEVAEDHHEVARVLSRIGKPAHVRGEDANM